jgi:TRAP-type C4-dicarboxylate transport system substrate-binding protein
MAAGRTRALALVAALAAVGLPACSTQISGPSLVLRLASPDPADGDTAAPIRHFVDEVDQLSDGTVRIKPVWDVTPEGTRDWDQVTAQTVIDGVNHLALVPTRAFDTMGVKTLRALSTPLLVTSPAALEAVLESSVRERLLSGLTRVELVGIDIFPDSMRHPFGYGEPLLDAEDYQGSLIRTPTSETSARFFQALGARVSDVEPPSTTGGAEAQFSLAPAGSRVATGNVTLFPKANALVMNASVADRLRPDQWQVLEDAAADTRDWQFAQQPSDFEQAVAYCDLGGTIVAASDEEIASLGRAAGDVTAWLREDQQTRELVDEISRQVEGVPAPTPITECPGGSASAESPEPGGLALDALDGRSVTIVTRRDLVRAGVTDVTQIRENTGRFAWTLDSGVWTYHQVANHFLANPDDSGRYGLGGHTLTIHWEESPQSWTRLRVKVSRDGDLTFTDIEDGIPSDQALSEGQFGQPWDRIGDLPD